MHRHCLLRMCSPMENNDALTGHLISPGPWPWSQRGLGEWVYRCVDQFLHSQHQCWEAHRKWAGCCFCVGSTGYFPYVISTRCSATLEKGLSSSHPRVSSPNREMMEQPRHLVHGVVPCLQFLLSFHFAMQACCLPANTAAMLLWHALCQVTIGSQWPFKCNHNK